MLAHPGSGGGASGRHAATGGGGPKPGTRTRWMAAPSGARIVRSSVATRATIPAAAGPRSGLHSTPPTRLLKPPGGRLTRRSPFPRLPSAAASRACTQTDAGDHRARRHHHPFVGPASLLDLVRLGSAALDVRRERVVARFARRQLLDELGRVLDRRAGAHARVRGQRVPPSRAHSCGGRAAVMSAGADPASAYGRGAITSAPNVGITRRMRRLRHGRASSSRCAAASAASRVATPRGAGASRRRAGRRARARRGLAIARVRPAGQPWPAPACPVGSRSACAALGCGRESRVSSQPRGRRRGS